MQPREAKRERPEYRERVYEIVRRIPAGRVMTYGQLAIILGEGYTPRTVGFVMHASEEESVPWQRVINSRGACSTGRLILPADRQQRMLEAEGIVFDERGRCDLSQYRWITDDENDDTSKERPSLFDDQSSKMNKRETRSKRPKGGKPKL